MIYKTRVRARAHTDTHTHNHTVHARAILEGFSFLVIAVYVHF